MRYLCAADADICSRGLGGEEDSFWEVDVPGKGRELLDRLGSPRVDRASFCSRNCHVSATLSLPSSPSAQKSFLTFLHLLLGVTSFASGSLFSDTLQDLR